VTMGQAKSKVDCPLCGGRSDTDDACDSPSVDAAESSSSPEKEPPKQTHLLQQPLLTMATPEKHDGGGHVGGGHASTASLPSYVGTGGGPLTSVAEEHAEDAEEDGTLAENHTTALRHQLVVLRGNRHHPPGHRVRSVHSLYPYIYINAMGITVASVP